ncbi:AAA domain containing protein [uncultured Caudovirales phage]|uniref:AAA domain containing protein n=1 Tax=uncultured Caudovirales phage TaxID=2100421 RepID=A0A6J7WXI7_9CAUD|nr:AAA domain containing protein [uncultured Caudovirales phage]
MVEEQIIKLFCEDKYIFTKYYKYVNINYIKVNYSNLYKLFITIDNYYNKYNNNNNINKQELELVYNSNYLLKDSERKELTELINRILDNEVSNKETVIGLLEEHRRRCLAGEVARTALDVEDGKASIESLLALFNDFEHQEVEATEAKAIQFDLRKLHETQVATPGLRWRLNFLNKSLGSLRQGDFGFIFARPETGKTTFLASEISKMIQQTDGEVLWFNNEEQGNKVAIRCYQAVLGVTTEKLFSNLDMYQKQFEDLVQNRIKIYDFEDSSRASRIEAILKESNPALIIFDQIDKIKGFKGDRNDLELKAIYQWAREIAKTYAPVIGVSQAGGEAEGKLWLTMDMVDGSKTAKQGEADWILGIGKEQDNTSRTRYLNITKNKLLGDSDTLPELRHGSAQVLIKPEIARYEDL